MFGSLKEKLKNWIKKAKEEDVSSKENKETKTEKKSKKPQKEKTNKQGRGKKKSEEISLGKQSTQVEGLVHMDPAKTETLAEPDQKERQSFFSKFQKKFTDETFQELFEELELILLQNNVAVEAIESIKNVLKEKLVGKKVKDVNLNEELKNSIKSILIDPPNFLNSIKETIKEKKPFIILFAGINGSGKTTTIAKVAHYLLENKLTVCLAAADTFRAAAIQQLEEHAKKLSIPIIKKDYGADPAAVGFDAVSYAKKHAIDVVLIDTAGRMQNKDSLMREIEKISRVNKPDMKIFLGESITGNDATIQARAFNEAIDITGIILSKADVDEKGGAAISVSHVTGKPILFLGTGQEYKDLEIFNKEKMIEKLGL